jgi:hypothetical protein
VNVKRLPPLALDQTLAALDAFVPSGDEDEDVARLYEITDPLADTAEIVAATPTMLRVFERYPSVLLGSPGPLVHCIEKAGLETFLPMLLESFRSRPNRMTLWMLERCLRSEPSTQSRFFILEALREVRRAPHAGDLHDDIDEDLAEYG